MKTGASTKSSSRKVVPLKRVQWAVSEETRWKIFDVLQQRGPLTTTFLAEAVGVRFPIVSKHVNHLREAGLLERRMGKLYAIPDEFLVPGERVVDFGAIVLRFDVPEAKA